MEDNSNWIVKIGGGRGARALKIGVAEGEWGRQGDRMNKIYQL